MEISYRYYSISLGHNKKKIILYIYNQKYGSNVELCIFFGLIFSPNNRFFLAAATTAGTSTGFLASSSLSSSSLDLINDVNSKGGNRTLSLFRSTLSVTMYISRVYRGIYHAVNTRPWISFRPTLILAHPLLQGRRLVAVGRTTAGPSRIVRSVEKKIIIK